MNCKFTCFFISCNKENNLDISKKNESHAKCAISNPYDIYGELHNLAMEEARKKEFFEDVTEIVDFSVYFTASHIEDIHPFYTVEEWISTLRECANFFAQEEFYGDSIVIYDSGHALGGGGISWNNVWKGCKLK